MADIIPVAQNFDQGFQSDISRNDIAPGAAYRMKDYIPSLGAPLRKRGGWSWASPDLLSLGGAGGGEGSIGFLPFPGDGHLVAVSTAGSVYQLKRFDGLGGAHITDTGDGSIVPSWPIFWHKTGTKYYGIILAGLRQPGAVPKKYYDTTGAGAYQSQPLGGTPPLARSGFSWGDYLVLLNYYDPASPGTLYNYRMAFSGVGNPDSWTLTGVNGSTFDFPEEIIAGLPMRSAVLVWGYNDCHILTGDTPPPGGNLARRIFLAGLGTIDGRSITPWRDYAIWANETGVYMSDASTLTDLTYEGGISTFYRQTVSGFAFTSGWSATAGIYHDRYILQIRNPAGAVTTLMCDPQRRAWTELTNFPGGLLVSRPAGPGTALFGGDEELFFAHPTLPRVGKVSSLWTPSAAVASDADGRAVLPSLETGYFGLGTDYSKRVRRIFLGYDIRTAGAAPYLSMGYVTSPEPGLAYAALDDIFPTTTHYRRKQGRVGQKGLGVGFKIDQVGASADTSIYDISLEAQPHDPTRATL